MNKDDLIKDFMSDINHNVLMKKYNLTKKEFDEFRTANQLDKDDRYILTDAAILEDCFAGYPDPYVMQKHNLTMHKLKRCLYRANTCIEGLDEHKRERIQNLYLNGTDIDYICYEYGYECSTVEYILKDVILLKRNIDIVSAYILEASVNELASKHNLHPESIRKILKENKVALRK